MKPNKELVKEKKSFRGGEQSKKRMAITVFVAADVSKPCDPVVVLRRQLLRLFRKLTVPTHPAGLHYFANAKSWMNIEIMKHILGRVDRQLKLENSHVILFLDNAPSYPEPLQDPPEFFKLVYLPKNATSKLEPADIGVIRNVKAKYIKLLVRHVSSLLNVKNTALTIVS